MNETTNMGEIGFDGLPRFRTEPRTCTQYFPRSERSCGRDFSVTWDRHYLDNGPRTCERCRDLPSIHVRVTATNPRSGERHEIYDTVSVQSGERTRSYDLLRRFVARALADGLVDVRISMTRHTSRRGYHERRWIRFSVSAEMAAAVRS